MAEHPKIPLATSPTGFFRFHWNVLRNALEELFSAKEKAEKAVTVIFTVLLLFNRQLAERAKVQWDGISGWWAAVPIVLLFLCALLRANHLHFKSEQYARFEAENRQKELVNAKQLKSEWERLKGKFISFAGYTNLQAVWSRSLPITDPNKRTWVLLGAPTEDYGKNLEFIIEEAGRLLTTSCYANEQFNWLKNESEDFARWLGFALEYERNGKEPTGSVLNRGVSHETGVVNNIAGASVSLCNRLASKEHWPV